MSKKQIRAKLYSLIKERAGVEVRGDFYREIKSLLKEYEKSLALKPKSEKPKLEPKSQWRMVRGAL